MFHFPGTPFEVEVIDSTSVTLSNGSRQLAKVYKEAGLMLDHQGVNDRDMDIKIVCKCHVTRWTVHLSIYHNLPIFICI